ncbi:MAG: GNAT family N-acetyltransferase [Gemmatimonadota bacterium]
MSEVEGVSVRRPGSSRAGGWPPDMTPNVSIREIGGAETFKALRNEWNELVEADPSATVFQTWEIQYHMWRFFEDGVRPVLLVIRDADGTLIGLAPFGSSTTRIGGLGVQVLGFLAPRFVDYADVIIRATSAPRAIDAIIDWLDTNLSRWDVVRFGPLREDSHLWRLREELALRLGVKLTTELAETSFSLRFEPGWTRYADGLKPKRAKVLRHETKTLLSLDRGAYEAVRGPAEIDGALTHLFDFHQRRMGERGERGAFPDPKVREEFRALVQALSAQGRARVHVIRSGAGILAASCTFIFRGVWSFYQTGFDPAHAKLSPGTVSRALRIDEAIREGATECDFLRGDEAYKIRASNAERRLHVIDLRTRSWRRRPYDAWRWLRSQLSTSGAARALYRRLRPKKVRPELLAD